MPPNTQGDKEPSGNIAAAGPGRAKRPRPIFQIGFNRCGTVSLHRFLLASGLRSRHWDEGFLARQINARMDVGHDPIMDFPLAVGFTDMVDFRRGSLIEPYKRFDYLHRWYPNALFILNTRVRENWIASRAAHVFQDGDLTSVYAKLLSIPEAQVPDFLAR